jgi:flagellar M-ring protein FliF
VALAMLVVGALIFRNGGEPRMVTLFRGLDADDAGQIVERLRSQHVPYVLAEDGGAILVPEEQVHEVRLSLASEGLPVGTGVGLELFDTQRFGESDFVEQVQYVRALEGELSRTIASLEGVESARVHLVLPERRLLGARDAQARASIAVQMRRSRRLRDDQVRGIVHLVSGSVRDLEPSNVTVVDGEGRRLSSGEDDEQAAEDAEGLRARIERAREEALQDLLDRTLGAGVAVVRVSADVSFRREERVEESYDPARVATRSFELTSEGANPEATGTAGIAGAVSALPGGPGPEPTTPTSSPGGRRSEVRNFEVTKVMHREVEPLGRVTRLSIAVVVDGSWEGEGADRRFVPRGDAELARIRAVVASAAGVLEARGDSIVVECVPFEGRRTTDQPATLEPDAMGALPTWVWLSGVAVTVLVASLLLLLVSRRRRRAREKATPSAAIVPTITPEPGPEGAATALAVSTAEALAPVDDDPDPDVIRARVIEIARREPELAARIIRAWLLSTGAEQAQDTPTAEAAE